jgi:hypothetical protein
MSFANRTASSYVARIVVIEGRIPRRRLRKATPSGFSQEGYAQTERPFPFGRLRYRTPPADTVIVITYTRAAT